MKLPMTRYEDAAGGVEVKLKLVLTETDLIECVPNEAVKR